MYNMEWREVLIFWPTPEPVKVTVYQLFSSLSTIKTLSSYIDRIDSNKVSWSELAWMISRDTHCIEIDPKSSDDINFIRSWYPKINQAKRLVREMLSENGLAVNTSKTENFKIFRNTNQHWKECKVLGSLLDTVHNIKRRYGLVTATYNILGNIFNSHFTKPDTKLKVFNSYVGSIFLYKSKLYVLIEETCKAIDCVKSNSWKKSWKLLVESDEQ